MSQTYNLQLFCRLHCSSHTLLLRSVERVLMSSKALKAIESMCCCNGSAAPHICVPKRHKLDGGCLCASCALSYCTASAGFWGALGVSIDAFVMLFHFYGRCSHHKTFRFYCSNPHGVKKISPSYVSFPGRKCLEVKLSSWSLQ